MHSPGNPPAGRIAAAGRATPLMAEGPVDFAVLGSSPTALLLAGLLAEVHHKSVCLVAEAHSSFRLSRGFDLSVGAMTRPETWALLRRTVPEMRRLLAAIGAKSALGRVDPLLVSETEAGSEALMHVRHLLLANAVPIERLTADGVGTTYRVSDALLFNRTALHAPAMKWLERCRVRLVPADRVTVTLRREGGRIERDGMVLEASHVIAADDNAILAHLDAAEREALLRIESATTLLTEPMKALPAPLTLIVDRDIVLLQRKGGIVQALAGGGADTFARMAARLGASGRVRRAGQTGFSALVPRDHAPIVGPVKALKASVVAGLGPAAAFLAPALARYFAGAAPPDEAAYFGAREVGKEPSRPAVAEYPHALALGSAS